MKKLYVFLVLGMLTLMTYCAPPGVNADLISYHCSFHPGMTGSIFLTNASSANVSSMTNIVTILDYAFSPANITIPRGSWVRWEYSATNPHDVTADDDSFSSGTLNSVDATIYKRQFN